MKETIHNEIRALVEAAVEKIAPQLKKAVFLTIPDKKEYGDYATNISFLLAPALKKTPRDIAKLVIRELAPADKILAKTELAGNGFINFFITKTRLYEELAHILDIQEKYGYAVTGKGQKIQIEFVSANPTGPLHVGHGRGAATGDSLARIYVALGYEVLKEYYVNNIGNQMQILGKSVQARYEGRDMPEDGYKGEYIKEIAKQIADDSRPAGVGGQGLRLVDENAFREYAIKTILSWIKKDLEDFGVAFDNWFNEQSLYDQKELEKVLGKLAKQQQIFEQDGAKFVRTTAYGDDKDRVIFRSDGRPTYFASDIAYHENKFKRGFDQVIDIWGADHHGYVSRMMAAVQALGYPADKLKIILYQLVSLKRGQETVPMSTRSGEFITLRQVLDEVGKDACRFFFLMRSPDSPLDFDLELAKRQSSDNPVYYVQYAYARICSIFKEAERNNVQLTADSGQVENLRILKETEEMDLIKKLSYFSKVLADCARTNDPHWLTMYLQETATLFHDYYTKHRIITDNQDLSQARIALIKAVSIVIKEGLGLLGISAPAKM